MQSAADDHDVVRRTGLRIAPEEFGIAERVFHRGEGPGVWQGR